MHMLPRRKFLELAALSAPFAKLAGALKKKVKITEVKVMIVRGTWDWNLVKIETDAGIYGIGEAYWGPGVKDVILKIMKPLLLGEDPLNVDKLYTKVLMKNGGAGAISGIEIALWDLAGRILETPVCNLLGGRFRDRVRFYRTMQPHFERHPAHRGRHGSGASGTGARWRVCDRPARARCHHVG
jgi:L-alanine-DL-glutamate epimerase-like enolase superfamily enzyme